MPDRTAARVLLALATSTGGVGAHVRALAEGLVAAGTPVTVAGPADTEQRFSFTAVGARFVPVEVAATPRPVQDAVAVVRLRRAARGCALVHAHGLRAGLLAGLAAGRRPLVVTWHNAVLASGPRRTLLALLERRVARRADVTLGASEDLVRRATALGARDARLAPVPAPPLAAATRTAEQVRAEVGAGPRPLLLAVGRLAPQKRYDVLLAAAAQWQARDEPPLLLVAGDGPGRDGWAARAAAAGLDVRFLGHRDDVADLLAAADLFLLSSEWEARPLVVQEALRAGVPVVATAVGGVPGLVGDAGVLVPWSDGPDGSAAAAGTAGALARAVSYLLDHPEERRRLSVLGRQRAEGLPDQAAMVEQVRQVHAGLTPWRGRRRPLR